MRRWKKFSGRLPRRAPPPQNRQEEALQRRQRQLPVRRLRRPHIGMGWAPRAPEVGTCRSRSRVPRRRRAPPLRGRNFGEVMAAVRAAGRAFARQACDGVATGEDLLRRAARGGPGPIQDGARPSEPGPVHAALVLVLASARDGAAPAVDQGDLSEASGSRTDAIAGGDGGRPMARRRSYLKAAVLCSDGAACPPGPSDEAGNAARVANARVGEAGKGGEGGGVAGRPALRRSVRISGGVGADSTSAVVNNSNILPGVKPLVPTHVGAPTTIMPPDPERPVRDDVPELGSSPCLAPEECVFGHSADADFDQILTQEPVLLENEAWEEVVPPQRGTARGGEVEEEGKEEEEEEEEEDQCPLCLAQAPAEDVPESMAGSDGEASLDYDASTSSDSESELPGDRSRE